MKEIEMAWITSDTRDTDVDAEPLFTVYEGTDGTLYVAGPDGDAVASVSVDGRDDAEIAARVGAAVAGAVLANLTARSRPGAE